MHFWLSLLLAAVVKDHGATLRGGCEADAAVIGELPAGTAVTIRYSLSGEAVPCYKIAAEMRGKAVEGYLPGGEIDGLETFENARKQGGMVGAREVLAAVGASASGGPGSGSGSLAEQASHLIESSQPQQAMELLEPELRHHPDPGLLALAGAAAWRGDDAQRALDLWRQSLAIQPNPQVRELYDRVEKETQADRSQHRLYGMKVLLRYEGTSISQSTAREMVTVVDQEFARISAALGCSTQERIVTIAQSRDAYRQTTAGAEWSAGQYDGRIRVPVFDQGSLDAQTRQTLAHEITHACLTMLGQWPAWLQEGVAQYMSGQRLTAGERESLAALAKTGRLPALARLGEDWSSLDVGTARVAYTLALRAVEVFQEDFSAVGLRNLLRNPDNLRQYTVELDKRLAR